MEKFKASIQKEEWGQSIIITKNDDIESGIFHIDENKSMDNHEHSTAVEYIYVLSGKAVAVFGDNEIKISKNDVLEIPPGVKHYIYNSNEEKLSCSYVIF